MTPSAIYIVTACCRPENLPLLSAGIQRARKRAVGTRIEWIVVFDGSKVAEGAVDVAALKIDQARWFQPKSAIETAGGSYIRNSGIALIRDPEAWVIFLDDDNLLSQEVIDALLVTDLDIDWLMPRRAMPDGGVVEPPLVPEVGNIDTAQIICRKRVLGDAPFETGYCADGVLASKLSKSGVKISRRSDLTVSYNALDRDETWDVVPGWLNVPRMYERVIDEIPSGGSLVEVGIYGGKSSFLMMDRIKELKKPVDYTVVDIWSDPAIRKAWAEAALWYRPLFSELWMLSTQAAQRFEDNSIDAVIIDADHQYVSVREDLAAWVPKVKRGGIVAGDDFRNPSWPGVERAVTRVLGSVEYIPPMGFFWRKP
jgi:glycosyltransferase involved in cell wall biosynthesis